MSGLPQSFVDGLINPLTTPAHVLTLLPLALVLARQPQRFVVLLVFVLALAAGCGLLSETYHPPEEEGAATIVLVNRIYPPGFNVWVDKKKAAFLEEGLAVRVSPGRHKIKLESKSTSLKGGMKKEDKRTFEYEVRVAEGGTEQVLLAWEHPG